MTLAEPPTRIDMPQLIAQKLEESDSADPGDVVAAIVFAIDDIDLRDALRWALIRPVRDSARFNRNRARNDVKRGRSARWTAVKDAAESGALAIYRWRMFVDDGWKFFGDCTPADLESLSDDLRKQAITFADQSQRYQRVLALMREANAETVNDLRVERLVEIFNA